MRLVAALLMALCLGMAACGGDDGGDTSTDAASEAPADETTADASSDAAQRLEEEAKPSYISSCQAGGAPANVCECAWDGLTEAYTPDELIDLLEQAGTGETPPELLEKQQEIVQTCQG